MGWTKGKIQAGAKAPEFQLDKLGGGSESLQGMLGRGPVLLAFFKVSCPVCQMTFPYLERLHRGADGKLQVVGVSQDNASATAEYNREFGVSFTTLLDGKGYPASNAYGVESVPTLFLVESDGSVSMSQAGFSKKDIEAAGRRVGATIFEAADRVPEFRPG